MHREHSQPRVTSLAVTPIVAKAAVRAEVPALAGALAGADGAANGAANGAGAASTTPCDETAAADPPPPPPSPTATSTAGGVVTVDAGVTGGADGAGRASLRFRTISCATVASAASTTGCKPSKCSTALSSDYEVHTATQLTNQQRPTPRTTLSHTFLSHPRFGMYTGVLYAVCFAMTWMAKL